MGDRLRVRTADLSWEQLDDEVVILDLASSNYLKLNGTAAELWPRLLDGADEHQLADDLRTRYGLDAETATRDVAAFTTQLREAGLLEAVDAP